jgi:hypothetical protein
MQDGIIPYTSTLLFFMSCRSLASRSVVFTVDMSAELESAVFLAKCETGLATNDLEKIWGSWELRRKNWRTERIR